MGREGVGRGGKIYAKCQPFGAPFGQSSGPVGPVGTVLRVRAREAAGRSSARQIQIINKDYYFDKRRNGPEMSSRLAGRLAGWQAESAKENEKYDKGRLCAILWAGCARTQLT